MSLEEAQAWICERTGADKIWQALFARHIPEAKGWVGWLYALGSASLLVFSVQAFTGALLAMNYAPTPDHAYDSVRFIDQQVNLGRVLRGIHHYGSSFMVVIVTLHLLRVYFMGSYKYPREATWIAGIGLWLLVLGFSFTGYLLPWDQKAYWATVVGTNIAGQAPIAGPAAATVLKGGSAMGAATLTRFFAIHVLVLPALIGALILVHLFLVVWHGISEPPRRKTDEMA
jgi:ubiquinol-cytochrome c reductase cytochrome b subunit